MCPRLTALRTAHGEMLAVIATKRKRMRLQATIQDSTADLAQLDTAPVARHPLSGTARARDAEDGAGRVAAGARVRRRHHHVRLAAEGVDGFDSLAGVDIDTCGPVSGVVDRVAYADGDGADVGVRAGAGGGEAGQGCKGQQGGDGEGCEVHVCGG